MADKITIVLGQKDHRDFELEEVRAVTIPPQTEQITVKSTEQVQVITPTKGKYINQVTVDSVSLDKPDQTKTTIPTKERQVIKADLGYELAENIVEPIPDEYITTIDADATVNDLFVGKTAYVNGEKITGEYTPLDISDTTATAGTVLQGEVFYDKDGVRTVGTFSLDDGTEVIVDLPEILRTATTIYYFKVNENTILLSGNATGSGVWVYKIDSNTMYMAYNANESWQFFQMINDQCLISSALSSNRGILLYNPLDDTVTKIYDTGYYWSTHVKVGEKYILTASGGSASYGILIFNPSNNTINRVYTSGSNWTNVYKIDDNKYIISSTSSISSSSGILLYNYITDTITKIYTVSYNWTRISKVGEKYLLSSTITNTGILLYNPADDSISQIYNIGYNYTISFQVDENKFVISSSVSATAAVGLFIYNLLDNTITQIYDKGFGWFYYQLIEGKYLIGGSYAGIILYNPSDDTVTYLYSTGNYWRNFTVINGKCIITANSNGTGILLYNPADDSITQIYQTNTGYFNNIKVLNDKILISSINSSSYNSGLIVYDSVTETATQIYKYGYNYDTFESEGNNYYISSSDNSINERVLYYNSTDSTATLVKYNLGVI